MIKIGCEKVKKASGTGKKPVYLSRWFYFLTRLVPRFPTLIVSGYLLIAAMQFFCVGLTLQTILKKNRQDFELELYRVMEQEKRTSI